MCRPGVRGRRTAVHGPTGGRRRGAARLPAALATGGGRSRRVISTGSRALLTLPMRTLSSSLASTNGNGLALKRRSRWRALSLLPAGLRPMGEPADATRVAYCRDAPPRWHGVIRSTCSRRATRCAATATATARIEAPNLALRESPRCLLRGAARGWTSAPGRLFVRSRRSFDVGNAFVFSPDALATVLALPLPRGVPTARGED